VASSAERVIGTSYSKARDALKTARFEPRATVGVIDKVVAWARVAFPPDMFDAIATACVRYGHGGLVAAQIFTALFCLVAAVKFSSPAFVGYGIGLVILLMILQYTASKFLNAGDALIRSSPSRLASAAFLDCLAVLAEVGGILLFLVFLARAQWPMFWIGLGLWALCDSVAYVALHPSMVNLSVADDVRAGEEALGILSFFVKALVKIVPIAFGVGSILGAVALLFATFGVLRTGSLLSARAALRLIIFCSALPFVSYVLFAFYHLGIDVVRSVLVLPGKLDDARKQRNT
jgi:hypothetical protein